MDVARSIIGAIAIIIGLVMLPLVATFVATSKENTSVQGIAGLTSILDLIAYGFAFGLVGLGVGMVYTGFKK